MRTSMVAWWFGLSLVLSAPGAVAQSPKPAAPAAPAVKTSCVSCHTSDMFDDAGHQLVAHFLSDDVHTQAGFSCHDCHGGNPDPKLAEDMAAAMDEKYAKNPFRGAPKRDAIPEFCGRCHSSPEIMQKYNPGARVDQVSEYWTSKHGQMLKKGDGNVATCIDCHGVHGIFAVSNPKSPVFPSQVAVTCSKCHADAKRMTGYKDDFGQQLPIDQYAKWRRSVHAIAMMDKGDLTAPTCNDCHGNHGAKPPGIDSVAYICGQCHGREADLFRASAKEAGFANHNDLLATGEHCDSCHSDVKFAPSALATRRFSECVTCHENHAVIRPTVAFLGTLPETPCAFCHEPAHDGGVAEPPKSLAHYHELRDGLLKDAAALKLTGDQRFDWLVDQAVKLPTHTTEVAEGGQPSLRPEFERLFVKFRIGKSHYTYTDPITGKDVMVPVRQCQNCHQGDDSVGRKTAAKFLANMRDVTGLTARAERILLQAQRGGVEVRDARAELDKAVDSQIELEVLVHSFNGGAAFEKKYGEGMTHAKAALAAGQSSLNELSYRREGLFVALGLIVLMLIALGLKIRSLG